MTVDRGGQGMTPRGQEAGALGRGRARGRAAWATRMSVTARVLDFVLEGEMWVNIASLQ